MLRNVLCAVFAGVIILLNFSNLTLAASSPGKERTETLIAIFKQIKSSDKIVGADKTANNKLFTELDGYLDFEGLTSKSIMPRINKFNKNQLALYKKKFKNLIRLIAYPNSGNFFRKAQYVLLPEQQKGELLIVPVKVKVPKEDLETMIEFQWSKIDGSLKIVDVSFEGDSLVKDYQNQLAKLVDKSGVEGLFKALDERSADLIKSR